jgi:predicted DNA binding protein
VVRIRFEISEDLPLKEFTIAHPELEASIVATQTLPDGHAVIEFDVTSQRPADYTGELGHCPHVLSVTRIDPVGPRTRYQALIDLTPSYVKVVNEFGALLRYPRLVARGKHTAEVAARTSQIRRVLQGMRQICSEVEVLRFGRGPMRTCPSGLTPHQVALLHHSLSAGYFDVPRRVTLTGLARGLNRSKSSVSRALAIIERQLVESSVGRPS